MFRPNKTEKFAIGLAVVEFIMWMRTFSEIKQTPVTQADRDLFYSLDQSPQGDIVWSDPTPP
ncbi:hypothetical protein ACFSQQ_19290 [Mesorhizobium kowhaii]|uniref:hypothetical protein n=1 Tax=Mesorhizobium kowhaii TaxID=1300272 RepID=UPI0035ED3F4A